MALPPPGGIGATTTPDAFPQWGSNGKSVTEAANAAAKEKLMSQGYLTWFATRQAAQAFVNSQQGPLSGLAAIGDFFGRLTEAATWLRVAKVLAGGMLLVIGLAHITGADNKVAVLARSVPVVPV